MMDARVARSRTGRRSRADEVTGGDPIAGGPIRDEVRSALRWTMEVPARVGISFYHYYFRPALSHALIGVIGAAGVTLLPYLVPTQPENRGARSIRPGGL
jgi:hypothetical protein